MSPEPTPRTIVRVSLKKRGWIRTRSGWEKNGYWARRAAEADLEDQFHGLPIYSNARPTP